MSVEALRIAIHAKAGELLPAALERAGAVVHKRNWRQCPCSWCETKREATAVIGSHVPRFHDGKYVSKEALRDNWREDKRRVYRNKLNSLAKELET